MNCEQSEYTPFLSFEPDSAEKKFLAYTIITKCDCDHHITHAFKREAIQNSHSIIFMDLNTIEYTIYMDATYIVWLAHIQKFSQGAQGSVSKQLDSHSLFR